MISVETFLRERFLRDHAHLITPWNFGPAATKACNESLLRGGWLRCDIAQQLAASPPPVDKPTA